MVDLPDALYEPDGDTLIPTVRTRGPWSPDAQHAGPPSALLVRAIERAGEIPDGQLARFAVDILRPVPLEPLTVSARHLRPGRRVELIEATLTRAGDPAPLMVARGWRLRRAKVEFPIGVATPEAPPEGPEGIEGAQGAPAFFVTGEESYASALQWHFVHGEWSSAGPAAVWTRMRAQLVAGETTTPLEHLLTMTDAAHGVAAPLDWDRYTFMNVDLSVVLERQPEGEWLAMDSVARVGTQGAGACTAVLSDVTGRIGTSTAALLVDSR